MKITARLLAATVLALALGAGLSLLKLRFYCRLPDAEACVWGKAYLPILLPLEALVFGILLLGVAILARDLSKRGRG